VVRSVTPQKPQRSTVSTDTSPLSLRKSGSRSHDPSEQRKYPATALGLMLVVGVLLGLLLAAVISSFVDGGASGNKAGATTSTSSTPSAIAGQKGQDLRTTQRTDQIQADEAPEDRDIRILGCGSDANGYASAQVLITNSTSKRLTYYVRVIFTTAGGRTVSDDVASVKHLPPGATAPLQTVNAVDAAPGEQVLCRLGGVTRF
jgi:hypothetical protein